MKVQRNFSSMEGSLMDSENNGKTTGVQTSLPRRHIRSASRVRPALALSVLDVVSAGKDGAQSSGVSIPKVITIRK